MRPIRSDPDLATTAALIGDPSRAAILTALFDGRALTAGELARHAGVSPQTASTHLDRLFKGNLLAVEIQGRHHYYRLRDERVAQLLERLAVIARASPAFTDAQRRAAHQLRFARSCYGHLAGYAGVAIAEALCRKAFLIEDELAYKITETGKQWFRRLGVEVDALRSAAHRLLTRRCLDWSERRHHLSGVLGVALAQRLFSLGWFVHTRELRVLRLTERGLKGLETELGIVFETFHVSKTKT
jgi:DNA-binding transcriptional ArsR family regulator